VTPTTGVRSTSSAIWATRIIFAANGGMFATWVSRLPAVRDRLDATDRGLGFALLFIAVGSLVAMPLSGRFITALGERRVIAICVVACMLAYPALGLAPNLVVLGAVLLVVGAGVGVWDVAMNVAGHAVEEQAGRTLMPGFHACWSLGTVAGAGLGALAAKADIPPAAHFAMGSAVVAAGAVWAIRRLPNAADADANGPRHTTSQDCADGEHHVPARVSGPVIRDVRLIGLGVMTFCAAWAEGAANDWLALLLADDRGASAAAAAAGFAVFATAMTMGRILGNSVVNRWGRVPILRVGALVAGVGVVILLTIPALAASYTGALLWGLGIAIAFPLAMSAAGETPGRGPAAIAMVATIAYSGFLVGPPLIGTIAHATGLDDALWIVVALVGGMLVLAGTARPVRAVRG
jgi:predicted MFS family arabinose efflux permease